MLRRESADIKMSLEQCSFSGVDGASRRASDGTPDGATRAGPLASAAEMDTPTGVDRPGAAPGPDSAVSSGKSSVLRRSYLLDS